MTATERTILMYRQLPRAEQREASAFVERMARKAECRKLGLKPLSEKDILKRLKKSDEDYRAGRVHSWEEVKAETRRRYGI